MRNIRITPVVYELLFEQAKQKRYKTVEDYLDGIARGKVK